MMHVKNGADIHMRKFYYNINQHTFKTIWCHEILDTYILTDIFINSNFMVYVTIIFKYLNHVIDNAFPIL